MFMIRKLVLLALQCNILFNAEHIPRKKNHLNHPLSRLQVKKLLHPMPEAERNPTPYPSTTTAEKLNATVDQLLEVSLARSTKSMYESVWNDFQNFCSDVLSSNQCYQYLYLHCHCI